jgi:hypothetical protein
MKVAAEHTKLKHPRGGSVAYQGATLIIVVFDVIIPGYAFDQQKVSPWHRHFSH